MFITPYSRIVRRRAFGRPYTQADIDYMESDVNFPIDVKADDAAYEIKALLPGVKPDDVTIQVVNETITISGEIRDERAENDTYLLRERPFGRFSRTLSMPAPLDSAGAEATFGDGVLTLRVPKAETARPKTIKVHYNQE
jgi:HSP20 family protein